MSRPVDLFSHLSCYNLCNLLFIWKVFFLLLICLQTLWTVILCFNKEVLWAFTFKYIVSRCDLFVTPPSPPLINFKMKNLFLYVNDTGRMLKSTMPTIYQPLDLWSFLHINLVQILILQGELDLLFLWKHPGHFITIYHFQCLWVT